MKTPKKSVRDVVKLTDLVPVRTIKGGSGRMVFGTDGVDGRQASVATARKPKDMTPKKKSKGGSSDVRNR